MVELARLGRAQAGGHDRVGVYPAPQLPENDGPVVGLVDGIGRTGWARYPSTSGHLPVGSVPASALAAAEKPDEDVGGDGAEGGGGVVVGRIQMGRHRFLAVGTGPGLLDHRGDQPGLEEVEDPVDLDGVDVPEDSTPATGVEGDDIELDPLTPGDGLG